jgi:methylmalonyl-CoA mutase C-terminal domain/subunit
VSATAPPRVLLAKPGLDGHDRGVKAVARALRDGGFEVIYLGLRSRPDAIAKAATDEDVDAVGLGILSGGHLGVTRDVIAALEAAGGGEIPLIVGGTIPAADVEELKRAGVAAVFQVGAPLEGIVTEMRRLTDPESGAVAG